MSLLSLLCVGVVFEEGSPSVTRAGPELEIPTLNLQEAGFRGVFLWVLCGSLLWLSLFCRDRSSGWPQTSLSETAAALLTLGLPLSGAGKTGMALSGGPGGHCLGLCSQDLKREIKQSTQLWSLSVGRHCTQRQTYPMASKLLSHPRRWRLGSAPIYRAVGGDPGGRNI